MPLTLRPAPTPLASANQPPARSPTPRGRTSFTDNTRLIITGIAVLGVALGAVFLLVSRSTTLGPDFLTEFVLYALSATNLAMLVALVFVLARNIIKLVVERRRALPFARFRAKLVAAMLGLTVIPAVLVLLVGSELILNSVDRWFNAPMDEVLTSANAIAGDYYQEQQRGVSVQAERLAGALASTDLARDGAGVQDLMDPDVRQGRLDLVEVYRAIGTSPDNRDLARIVDVRAPAMPPSYRSTSGDRLAERAAAEASEIRAIEPVPGGGELIRSAIPIRASPDGDVRGVVIASQYLTGQFATRARAMTDAYEDYQQLRVLRQPLAGVYLSFFLLLTLMILVAATWMGLYLAKRITRPVQLLANAANEIGAGHLDHRVIPETADEFGALVEAFNRMAGELATDRSRLQQTSVELEHKHQDVEGRRRYVETILDRVATGVVSVDSRGRIGTANRAAARLLGIDEGAVGQPASVVFGSADLKALAPVVDEASRRRARALPQELTVTPGGHEVHLTVTATPLVGDDGSSQGVVLVLDDITPLVRAQRAAAWREVARRLAHEIKNPLTPIQLCAERLQRHFSGASDQTRGLVDECTTTIVGEVESLKKLVDEFSAARTRALRTTPTDLHALLSDALSLYNTGILPEIELVPRFTGSLPLVPVDPEQMRRVIINLVDNAVEAMGRRGRIEIETEHVAADGVIRIVIADNGPGIPAAKRDELFEPYFSTKNRGSGLGLAIVKSIVAEHGGRIRATDNVPRGARFTIELPC